MDISKLEAELAQDETGVAIPIYKKNGEPYRGTDGTPSTITVLGRDAKRVRAARDVIQRRLVNRRAAKIEPADLMRNRVDVAVAASIGWSGWESAGQPCEFTSENLAQLLRGEHILEQIEAGMDGHADFFSINSSS